MSSVRSGCVSVCGWFTVNLKETHDSTTLQSCTHELSGIHSKVWKKWTNVQNMLDGGPISRLARSFVHRGVLLPWFNGNVHSWVVCKWRQFIPRSSPVRTRERMWCLSQRNNICSVHPLQAQMSWPDVLKHAAWDRGLDLDSHAERHQDFSRSVRGCVSINLITHTQPCFTSSPPAVIQPRRWKPILLLKSTELQQNAPVNTDFWTREKRAERHPWGTCHDLSSLKTGALLPSYQIMIINLLFNRCHVHHRRENPFAYPGQGLFHTAGQQKYPEELGLPAG